MWLSSPIIVMIIFGFNNATGKFNIKWQGFTLKWYRELFDDPRPDDCAASTRSSSPLVTTVIATVLGTCMGMALGRYRFRGSGSVNLLLFANIAAPEVVLGAALLSMFLTLGVPRGFWTIMLAHVMFSIAYVAVTVRARMAGLDPSLEEASRDLGAGAVTTFFKVTLPIILPGVMAGALLAFALSIDDYIITSFNAAGPRPSRCGSTAPPRTGGSVPPQVNVMGTLIFAVRRAARAQWLRLLPSQAGEDPHDRRRVGERLTTRWPRPAVASPTGGGSTAPDPPVRRGRCTHPSRRLRRRRRCRRP